jgi:hypothetical protein
MSGAVAPTTNSSAWFFNETSVGLVIQSGGTLRLRSSASTTDRATLDSAGKFGIGVTPTAFLHLIGGTSSANTAPLKINSGTLLATTEAGAVENDGMHLYYSAANGGTRFQLDQQSGGGSFVALDGTSTGGTAQAQTFQDGVTLGVQNSVSGAFTLLSGSSAKNLTFTLSAIGSGGIPNGRFVNIDGSALTNNTARNFKLAAGDIDLAPLITSNVTGTGGAVQKTNPTIASPIFTPIAFASLGTPIDGTFNYCNDCTIANPCASGGTGALAKRLNGVWVCN